MKINGILHIGAHKCKELNDYINSGCPINKIIWIEGNPQIVEEIKNKNSDIKIFNYLISDKDNKICNFNIGGMSSSMLKFDKHKKYYPHIKFSKTIKMKTKRIVTPFIKIIKFVQILLIF